MMCLYSDMRHTQTSVILVTDEGVYVKLSVLVGPRFTSSRMFRFFWQPDKAGPLFVSVK